MTFLGWFSDSWSDGEFLVYSAAEKLEDTLQVGGGFDGIACSAIGDRIYLSDRPAGKLQIVEIDFIREINTAGSPFLGPPEAPVTVVVFRDFQWPYCARLVPLLRQVLEQYPREVKVVVKNFPLSMHELATSAALVAMAAHKQGKFWPHHDKLFAKSSDLSEKKFKEIAAEFKLNKAQFEADRKDPVAAAFVNRDVQDGLKAEVPGVPSIFVNGRLLKDRSLQGVRDLIQEASQPLQ